MLVELKDFCNAITEYCNIQSNKVTPNSYLVSELGIAGDDGYDLLKHLEEKFSIKFDREYDYSECFGNEGMTIIETILFPFMLLYSIYCRFTGKIYIPKGDISIKDLFYLISDYK